MKKFKLKKQNVLLGLIVILSAILNFVNLGIEGYGNSYYAAAVKSMTLSFKNFFFVAFDPSGFVSIDKPPVGFWFQALSAKIFGYSGVSIILPSAIAGVLSVIVIYKIVKRSFGEAAGLLSALFLAITPVFVAVSRNNTIDNILVLFLLLAMWALSLAAEKGNFKYLILSMALVGIGFNVKMLQAYMIVPALYITYLLSTAISFKKRIIHLAVGTVILLAVSLSWALIVDAIPASNRPYVDSSTNNTVTELILGHNGVERLSLGSSQGQGGGPHGKAPSDGQMKGNPPSFNNQGSNSSGQNMPDNNINSNVQSSKDSQNSQRNIPNGGPQGFTQNGNTPPNMPGGSQSRVQDGFGGQGGNSSQLQGSFGSQVSAGFLRLFGKNILSDQIVWFIPLAVIGFIAAAIRERLRFKLDNKKKQSLALWFLCFLPEFIYFSFNTGTFHSYYLTMLAAPIAALAAIGIVSMWKLYKDGGLKSWFLPIGLIANGIIDLIMLYYFIDSSNIIKVLMVLVAALSILTSIILMVLNVKGKKSDLDQNQKKLAKTLVILAVLGITLTPLVGSSTVLFTSLNSSFPAAGLELLSSINQKASSKSDMPNMRMGEEDSANSKLISFLEKNKTSNQKYLLVVSNSNSAAKLIVKTGEPVMSLGGFLGNDQIVTLSQFKEMVKKGEIRYVMAGGQGGGSNSSSSIMNWVKQVGTLVSSSEYSNASAKINATTVNKTDTSNSSITNNNLSSGKTDTSISNDGGMGNSGQLYDLKSYTDSIK